MNQFSDVNVKTALRISEELFRVNGIESEKVNARRLLCSALSISDIELLLRRDNILSADESNMFDSFVQRRIAREPLQYIIGETDFYNVRILVNPSTLIPRPETEELVDLIVKKIGAKDNLNIIDICSGSGAIGLALAKRFPKSRVTLADISISALDLSKESAKINNIDNVDYIQFDALSIPYKLGKYDVIASNPPYIPENEIGDLSIEVKDFEPLIALTDFSDGFTFYKVFALELYKILKIGGFFALELGYDNPEYALSLFSNQEYFLELKKDFNNVERFLIGDCNQSSVKSV